MSSGGGSKESQKSFDQRVAQWDFNYSQMKDAKDYRDKVFTAQKKNAEEKIDLEFIQAEGEWADNREMQIYDHSQAMKAHNASKIAAKQQVEMVDLAHEIAADDNKRVWNDRMTQIGFENEELLLGQKQLTETSELALQEMQGKRGLASQQGSLSRKEIAFNKDTKIADSKLNKLGVTQGLKSASEVAGLNARGLILDLQKLNSEVNQKSRQNKLAMFKNTGVVAASGQVGRSARKRHQAAMAEYGNAQTMLVDAMTKSSAEHQLNMDKLSQTLADSKRKGELDYSKLSNQIIQAGNSAILSSRAVDLEQNAADLTLDVGTRQTGLQVRHNAQKTAAGQKQLQASIKSAKAEHNATTRRLSLEKRQGYIDAKKMELPEPELVPETFKPIKPDYPTVVPPPPIPGRPEYDKTRPVKGGGTGGSGFLGTFLQIAAVGAQFIPGSDDRFKYNLNRVGTSPSGIPKYTFKYRLDGPHGPTWSGTSAQDLLAMGRGDAVVQKEKDGFYYVDYSKLDVEFEQVTA